MGCEQQLGLGEGNNRLDATNEESLAFALVLGPEAWAWMVSHYSSDSNAIL